MKLFYAQTSPYARKVRLVIRTRNLLDQIEEIACDAFSPPAALKSATPLEKIPTLILDDGSALYDSPLICQYLDSLGDAPALIPAEGDARWETLRWEALCDGLMDSSYHLVMENRRAETERSGEWLERWSHDIQRVLGSLETSLDSLPPEPSLAPLALAAAIGYLELRLPHHLDEKCLPTLVRWYQWIKDSPAMQATSAL